MIQSDAFSCAVNPVRRRGKSRGTQKDQYNHNAKVVRSSSTTGLLSQDGRIAPRLTAGVACLEPDLPDHLITVTVKQEISASTLSPPSSTLSSPNVPIIDPPFHVEQSESSNAGKTPPKHIPIIDPSFHVEQSESSNAGKTPPKHNPVPNLPHKCVVPREIALLDEISELISMIEKSYDDVRYGFDHFFPKKSEMTVEMSYQAPLLESKNLGFSPPIPSSAGDLLPPLLSLSGSLDVNDTPQAETNGTTTQAISDDSEDSVEIIGEYKKPVKLIVIDGDEDETRSYLLDAGNSAGDTADNNIYETIAMGILESGKTENDAVENEPMNVKEKSITSGLIKETKDAGTITDLKLDNEGIDVTRSRKKDIEKRRKRRKHRERDPSKKHATKLYRCPETGETLTRPSMNCNTDSDSEGDFEHFLSKENRNTKDIVRQRWVYENELSEMSDFVVSESDPLIYDDEEEEEPRRKKKLKKSLSMVDTTRRRKSQEGPRFSALAAPQPPSRIEFHRSQSEGSSTKEMSTAKEHLMQPFKTGKHSTSCTPTREEIVQTKKRKLQHLTSKGSNKDKSTTGIEYRRTQSQDIEKKKSRQDVNRGSIQTQAAKPTESDAKKVGDKARVGFIQQFQEGQKRLKKLKHKSKKRRVVPPQN